MRNLFIIGFGILLAECLIRFLPVHVCVFAYKVFCFVLFFGLTSPVLYLHLCGGKAEQKTKSCIPETN